MSTSMRRDQRGKQSPLIILIESIEAVLLVFEGRTLFAEIGPNPCNIDPRYRTSTRRWQAETVSPRYRALARTAGGITSASGRH